MKACIGVICLLASAPALAQPPDPPDVDAAAGSAAAAPETAPVEQGAPVAPPVEAQADEGVLTLDELSDLRGGETVVIQNTTQALTANNRGNSVVGDTVGSGAVNLGANAFNGYDGIGNFVINTGHNNNLQGSISVSIAMTPQ